MPWGTGRLCPPPALPSQTWTLNLKPKTTNPRSTRSSSNFIPLPSSPIGGKQPAQEAIWNQVACAYFETGRTSMRRYSRVRMPRSRGATLGSQGISSERQRSIADRRSRRYATQEGHASMCPRISSQVAGSTLPSRYSDRLAKSSRHASGRRFLLATPSFVRRPTGCEISASPTALLSSRFISFRTLNRAR